ncbi:flagellar biosynthesis protein FlhF [Caproiciproducens sp. MSJ-32]|mgnify:CR=1 FL=1|uniref:flagellar biosynthesis protein FlhF n=1 Tax=Caproiciproducens sp. MSJ-32 TaxID=2841527 RepID=UPI001C1136FD|nr:flagellar biosynthesis protein FlhF [Caproiciproducens sp. MSJ-32]MBU5454795.1 flagellar biosynthesis protein FlhF [Caproiciproducens sp. MSJ-32]
MVIKKYLVKDMNEALTRIRYEMGKDAIIISQRKIKKPGFFGYFKPKMIEVTAALENNKLNLNSKQKKSDEFDINESINSLKQLMKDKSKDINSNLDSKKEDIAVSPAVIDDNIKDEVKEIKELLNKVIRNTTKEKEDDEILNYLREIDVEEDLLKELLNREYDTVDEFKEDFKKLIKNDVKIINENLQGKVVLVGPTGVGKTTTIAKLAGRLALIDKKKVGLITIDTYRIGAVDQLRTYAEIMNIPFKVVITLKEMESAVEELKDCDIVLIDTTGRSSKNTMQISELRAFIQKITPDSTMLVISGTTKNRDIDVILDGYRELNYERLIITKLDETIAYGCIYNIARKSEKPIAYITTGQNVPDDIKCPSFDEVEKLILGEESIC